MIAAAQNPIAPLLLCATRYRNRWLGMEVRQEAERLVDELRAIVKAVK